MFSTLENLFRDPRAFLLFTLYRAPAVLIALTLHEVAHGYVALRCGDPTARNMGRLSLNPLHHLDPLGTLFLFLLGFGWAKPVPVNPSNYRNGRRDDVLVSLAGVTTNFILFVLSTFVVVLLSALLYEPFVLKDPRLMRGLLGMRYSGFYLQMDPAAASGLAGLIRTPWLLHVQRFLLHLCTINLGLCLFNLLPIPPLDGFHVFNDILLGGRLRLDRRAFQIAQAALFVLLFATNIVGRYLAIAMDAVQGTVLSIALSFFGM